MLYEYLVDQFGEDTADIIAKLLIVLGILIVTWITRQFIAIVVARVVPHVTRRTQFKWDNDIIQALQPPMQFVVGVAGLWIAIVTLGLSDRVEGWFGQIKDALIAFAIFWALYRLVAPAVHMFWSVSKRAMRHTVAPSVLDRQLSTAAIQVIRAAVVILGFSAVLEAWGYDVAGVVAGLGIGGLAVALAAQNTLENVFGYFMILADDPFVVDEYIIMGNVSGLVESIGFRSTRVRALDQSLIIVPNKTIANSNIINWSRLQKRRLNMTVGITYDTTPDQILSVVQTIREMLENHEQVQADSVVVQFADYNASSLDLIIVCFAKVTAWADFQAFKQDVNLRIMRILADYKAEVAFPTQTLYHHVMDDPEASLESVILPPPEPEPARSTASDSPAGGDSEKVD